MADERVESDATQKVASDATQRIDADATERVDVDATRRVTPLDADLALAPGQQVFGRYTLEAEIGRGGMGVVWRARDEELGETVALKFLPIAVARDPVAVEELKDETRRA
ncbi:MAG: hypothetical protein FJ399_24110, partial [Verrucomicrobia bacterium]|nr:hypothetical protein [Verrucomicrobiota bacterium]